MDGVWVPIDAGEAASRFRLDPKRCPACHGPMMTTSSYVPPIRYPMVCPSYSAQRSSLAKAIGLGVPGAQAEQATATTSKGRRKAA